MGEEEELNFDDLEHWLEKAKSGDRSVTQKILTIFKYYDKPADPSKPQVWDYIFIENLLEAVRGIPDLVFKEPLITLLKKTDWSIWDVYEFCHTLSVLGDDTVVDIIIQRLKNYLDDYSIHIEEDVVFYTDFFDLIKTLNNRKAAAFIDEQIELLISSKEYRASRIVFLLDNEIEKAFDIIKKIVSEEQKKNYVGIAELLIKTLPEYKKETKTVSIDLIIDQSQDKDWLIRFLAVKELTNYREKEAVNALLKASSDRVVCVQTAAIRSMKIEEDSSIKEHLIELLGFDNILIKSEIIRKLGELNNLEVIQPLLDIALSTKDEDSLIVEVKIWSELLENDEQKVNFAIEKTDIRLLAVQALSKTKNEETLIKCLNVDYAPARLIAIEGLGELQSTKALDQIIKIFEGTKDGDSLVKIANVLDKIGDEKILEPLKAKLLSEDLKWSIKEDLDVIYQKHMVSTDKDKKISFESLQEQLNDAYFENRRRAVEKLAELEDERTISLLIEALKDEDSYVRKIAAEALGILRDLRAVDPLIELLNDENQIVRTSTIRALGQLQNPRVLEALEKILDYELEEITNLDCESIVLLYLKYYKYKNSYINTIEDTIYHLGGKDNYPKIERSFEYVICDAISGLSKPEYSNLLIKIFSARDYDWRVKSEVVEALGNISEPKNLDFLGNVLFWSKSMDSSLGYYTAKALGKIKSTISEKYLLEALKDVIDKPLMILTDIMVAIIDSIGEVGSIRSIESLVRMQEKCSDKEVTIAIDNSLEKIRVRNPIESHNNAQKDTKSDVRTKVARELDLNKLYQDLMIKTKEYSESVAPKKRIIAQIVMNDIKEKSLQELLYAKTIFSLVEYTEIEEQELRSFTLMLEKFSNSENPNDRIRAQIVKNLLNERYKPKLKE